MTTDNAYRGELLTGEIHAVRKEPVIVNWDTKEQRPADVVVLATSDGRNDELTRLVLPPGWDPSRFVKGTSWTFGIRSYATKAGKIARAIRVDLEPYQPA